MAVLPASAAPGLRSAAGPAAGAPVATAVATLPVWGYTLPIDAHSSSYPGHHRGVVHQPELLCSRRQRWEHAAVQRAYLVTAGEHRHEHVRLHIGLLCDLEILVAMDADGYRSTWNGSHWRAPTLTDPESVPSDPSVSCPTVSFCAVVDQFGKGALWNGTKWTTTTVAGGGDEQSVSCVSSSFCVAGDLSGVVYTWNGKKWSGPSNVDPGAAITAVSCVRGPFCVAAGANAETFNGSKWTPHGPIAPVDLESAACVTSRFCIVGDDVGDAYVWNGGRFSNQGMIDPDASISRALVPLDVVLRGGLFQPPWPVLGSSTAHHHVQVAGGDEVGPIRRQAHRGGRPGRTVRLAPDCGQPAERARPVGVAGTSPVRRRRRARSRFVIRVTDPLGQHFQRHFAIKVER